MFAECRGELFKWASHDDLYARNLLRRCIEALDERPDAILAHADPGGSRRERPGEGPLRVQPSPPAHRTRRSVFRSMLFEPGGDDFYGVIRADALRRVKPMDSYHHADRTFVAEIALHGPFHQVPELLYFRRDHPTRAERANPSKRSRCVNLDPRRAGPLHPTPRLLAEYVWGFVAAIRRAPLSPGRPARLLPPPGRMDDQPGPAGRRRAGSRTAPRSTRPCSPSPSTHSSPAVKGGRHDVHGTDPSACRGVRSCSAPATSATTGR